MKTQLRNQLIGCLGLIMAASLLHYESIASVMNRQLALFHLSRDGLLSSVRYEFFGEVEYLDKKNQLNRILVFTSKKESENKVLLAVANEDYRVRSMSSYFDKHKIHNISIIEEKSTPLLEIVHFKTEACENICANHFDVVNHQVLESKIKLELGSQLNGFALIN